MAVARRTYLYVLAFAGLLTVLYAASGLLALLVNQFVLTVAGSVLVGAADLRTRASLYLAALVVGLPIWLGHWLIAERAVARAPEERAAVERRVFLAAVFGVTAVIALYALHTVLRFVFTLPGSQGTRASEQAGAVEAGARLLAFGLAWLAHARIPRASGTIDDERPHDLARYVLTGFALAFLLLGLNRAVEQIVRDLLRAGQPAMLAGPVGGAWLAWGAIAAWLVSGGGVWAMVWGDDQARGGRRDSRIVFLYIVLIVATPVALTGGANLLYELVRRLLGYEPPWDYWSFLPNNLSFLLPAAATWAYHWAALRRQAAFAPETTVAGGIAWPRRAALALLTAFGLAMVAPAVVVLLWLGLDALFDPGTSPGWWRDRLSFSLAAGAVGALAWLGGWTVLQRAAVADPARERTADERRRLLGSIALAGALATLGFLIALLWLAFQTLLGNPFGPTELSRALRELSGAVVAASIAAYHGQTLRRDLQAGGPLRARVRIIALVASDADAALAHLRERAGLPIEIAGRLAPEDGADLPAEPLDLPALADTVAALGTDGRGGHALLIVYPAGGTLYRYEK